MSGKRRTEIWFRWFAPFGFLPCHWKGWVLLTCAVGAGIAAVELLGWMAAHHAPRWALLLVVALLFADVIGTPALAGRHTARPDQY